VGGLPPDSPPRPLPVFSCAIRSNPNACCRERLSGFPFQRCGCNVTQPSFYILGLGRPATSLRGCLGSPCPRFFSRSVSFYEKLLSGAKVAIRLHRWSSSRTGIEKSLSFFYFSLSLSTLSFQFASHAWTPITRGPFFYQGIERDEASLPHSPPPVLSKSSAAFRTRR